MKEKSSADDKRHQKLVDKLEKEFGASVFSTLSRKIEREGHSKVEFITTGCLAVDAATGGGFPRGRIAEVFGGESSSKTTLCMTSIAKAQRRGLKCAFIDAEHSTDPQYVAKLGVDLETLFIANPEFGEQALQMVETCVDLDFDLIVVDSVAAMVPKKELDGDMDEQQMGLQARMMGKAIRKLKGKVKKANCSLVFINQLREKFGVMFGDKDDSPGGKALKFAAELRLRLAHLGFIKEGDVKMANKVKVTVKKSKVGIQGMQAEYIVIYGRGIDKNRDLFDTLQKRELLQNKTKNGKKFVLVGEYKFKDYDDFCDRLREEKGLRSTLVKLLRSSYAR